MAQWLPALVALAEDLPPYGIRWLPTCTGDLTLSWPPWALHTFGHMVHMHACRKNTHVHKIKINPKRKGGCWGHS